MNVLRQLSLMPIGIFCASAARVHDSKKLRAMSDIYGMAANAIIGVVVDTVIWLRTKRSRIAKSGRIHSATNTLRFQ